MCALSYLRAEASVLSLQRKLAEGQFILIITCGDSGGGGGGGISLFISRSSYASIMAISLSK